MSKNELRAIGGLSASATKQEYQRNKRKVRHIEEEHAQKYKNR